MDPAVYRSLLDDFQARRTGHTSPEQSDGDRYHNANAMPEITSKHLEQSPISCFLGCL